MRLQFPMTVKCTECGEEFTRTSSGQSRICKKCQYKKYGKMRKKPERKRIRGNKKPEGMSEARWRCEQRRRLNPEYYALCGEFVA